MSELRSTIVFVILGRADSIALRTTTRDSILHRRPLERN